METQALGCGREINLIGLMVKITFLVFVFLNIAVRAQFSLTGDGLIGIESGLSEVAGMEKNTDLVLSPSLETGYGFKLLRKDAKLGVFGNIDHYVENSTSDLMLEINGSLKHTLNSGTFIESISASQITQSGIDTDEPANYMMYKGQVEYRHKMKHRISLKYSAGLIDVKESSRLDLFQTIKTTYIHKSYSMFHPGVSIPVSLNYSSEKSYRYWAYGVQLMVSGLVNIKTFYLILFNYKHRFYPKEKIKRGNPGNTINAKADINSEMQLSYLNLNLTRELSSNFEVYLDYVFYTNSSDFYEHTLFLNKIGAGFTWVH